MLDYIKVSSGTTAGGAGASTSNATSTEEITGELVGFYVKYNDSPPAATTDVTIATVGTVLPDRTLLTITNAATDGFFAVRYGAVSTSNAAITNSFDEIPLYRDKIKVTVAQANDGDSVDVWMVYER